jgi:hypothetical protein
MFVKMFIYFSISIGMEKAKDSAVFSAPDYYLRTQREERKTFHADKQDFHNTPTEE